MEFIDDEQSPHSNKKNISDEINSLRNEIQEDLNDIINYKINTRDQNRNNQEDLELYLDMIETCEERINKNTELLKIKIQELINHPLNTINPSNKKREREITPSQSGGTRKNKSKRKRKSKNKRTIRH
jgi:type III secretory pathway component EscV